MFQWNPEKIEKLKELRADTSLTTVEIAGILGCTKNAVCGKAHRLSLESRPGGFASPSHPQSRGVRRPPKHREKAAPAMPVQSLDIPFMELDAFHCREVTGQGEDGLATYCGHIKKDGSSYCIHHSEKNEYLRPRSAKPYARNERRIA